MYCFFIDLKTWLRCDFLIALITGITFIFMCSVSPTTDRAGDNQNRPNDEPKELLVDLAISVVNINSIKDIIEHVVEEFLLQT